MTRSEASDFLLHLNASPNGRGRPKTITGICQIPGCRNDAERTIPKDSRRIQVCRSDFDKIRRASARPCSWPKCRNLRAWNKLHTSRPGYCRRHERDFLLNHPLLPAKLDHISNNVVEQDGCWKWLKDPEDDSPFSLRPRGKINLGYPWLPYRFVYVATVGVIPAPRGIDHLCGQGVCVLPVHMEPVTQAENNRRQVARERGMNSGDPAVRARTVADTKARIRARAEDLMVNSEEEQIGLQIEALGRKLYPSTSPFMLAHDLVEGFVARPPRP